MSAPNTIRSVLVVFAIVAVFGSSLRAGEPKKSPRQLITKFSQTWNEEGWIQKSRRRPPYMRQSEDTGWPARMLALHGLVSHGKTAVPALVNALETGSTPERILAAQALGYLAPDVEANVLAAAARNDKDAAVRLYAVDALGMRGRKSQEPAVDWQALRNGETNNDVRKHIGYAIERKNAAVASDVVEALKRWDPKTINTAVVGKPAPDFELKSATGETVRLSQYRGKKAVVLVFIYGDT